MKPLLRVFSFFLSFNFLFFHLSNASEDSGQECKQLLDICFVIDASDSIYEADFKTLRSTIAELVDRLPIGVGNGRMCIVVYSRDIALEVPLTWDKDYLKQQALSMPHPRDGTYTNIGIQKMTAIFSKTPRDGVPKVGVVVTDGISKDRELTALESRIAREQFNINMYSVGVSYLTDIEELRSIASSDAQALTVESFAVLAANLETVVKLVCPADCGVPPYIERATVSPGSTLEGTSRTYTCEALTITEGETKTECQSDGHWSVTIDTLYCRPDCGEPPSVLHTTLSRGGSLEGDVRFYKCLESYVPEGALETVCQKTGQWSPTNLYCRPDCGIPDSINRGSVEYTTTLEGGIATYSCIGNNVLQGQPTIVCQKDGTWSYSNTYCRPDCGIPNPIQRGRVEYISTLEGSIATYSCKPNNVLEGEPSIVCLSNGAWSYSTELPPYCRPDCGEPPSIKNAIISLGGTLEGERRLYSCLKGFVAEGNPETVCQNNGLWLAINLYCRPDCGEPISVKRGILKYTSTLEGSIASYSCLTDSVLEGQPTLVCREDGTWSYADTYCRPNCGEPNIIPRGVVQYKSTFEGGIASYSCLADGVLEGESTIVCREDGTWSDGDIYCRPNCGLPKPVPRGIVEYISTLEGSRATYSCLQNNLLEGDPTIVCQSNGAWSYSDDAPVYCRPDCGKPKSIERGSVQYESTLEGSQATYVCLPGNVLEGPPTVVCRVDGAWSYSDIPPYCRPDCGVPAPIDRGLVDYTSTLEGGSATYSCLKNNVLEGQSTVVCQPDGRWSYSDNSAYCRPDCGKPKSVDRGLVKYTSTLEGSEALYSCLPNNALEGQSTILCGPDGIWLYSDTYCRPNCGEPKFIERSTINFGANVYESIRKYSCDTNTRTEGSTEIVCQENGKWTETNLYCRPDCGIPKEIHGAIVSYTDTVEGEIAHYTCKRNAIAEGQKEIICQNDGFWSTTDFYCRPDCGIPSDIEGASVSYTGTVEGDAAHYKCKGNSLAEGQTKIVCQPDGFWSRTDLYCRPDCGVPREIEGASLSYTGTFEGQKARYKCEGNTVSEGQTEIICQKDGFWSTTDLFCREITTTPLPPSDGLCNSCKMKKGIGLNPHPEDCDKYIKCIFSVKGEVIAHIKECPFGEYWDQNSLMCRNANDVFCSKDKCRIPGLTTYPNGKSNCRAYWICTDGRSTPMCCPKGYAYIPFQGCVFHPACKDSCKLHNQYFFENVCLKRTVPNKPNVYEEVVDGAGWIQRSCPEGEHYDSAQCQCTYNKNYIPQKGCRPLVHIPFDHNCLDQSGNNFHIENHNVQLDGHGLGFFNGKAKLVIPDFPDLPYAKFLIKIRYLDNPKGNSEGLVSNGDCWRRSPSLMMVKTDQDLHFIARNQFNEVTSAKLPSKPACWNEAFFVHNTKKIKGGVNGKTCDRVTYGPLKRTNGGLVIGHVQGFSNFNGFMDYVTVYCCQHRRKYKY